MAEAVRVSVSTVEGSRVNSQRPSRQRRETWSSWCPSLRLPSLRCPEQKQEPDPLHSSTERVGGLLSSAGPQGHLLLVFALMSQHDSQESRD